MADGASERNRMSTVDIPPIIRGQIIETHPQRFDARAVEPRRAGNPGRVIQSSH
jgi:hypothetical protein